MQRPLAHSLAHSLMHAHHLHVCSNINSLLDAHTNTNNSGLDAHRPGICMQMFFTLSHKTISVLRRLNGAILTLVYSWVPTFFRSQCSFVNAHAHKHMCRLGGPSALSASKHTRLPATYACQRISQRLKHLCW